jgi:sulfotransferase
MSKLIPFCGLPRSGSTLLCNIIGQHPDITLSADSCLSNVLINITHYVEKSILESQYSADLSYKLFEDFMDSGIQSWMNNLSQTKFYLDKSRGWSELFDYIFSQYPNTKIIFTIRDLRGIYLSFDRLSRTAIFPQECISYNENSPKENSDIDFLNKRIEHFLDGDMVRPHLIRLKEIFELEREYLQNIKIIKYEDFMENPEKELFHICRFLGLDQYSFNLNDISQIKYNDCIYLPYGYHKIKNNLTPNIPNYDNKLRRSAQNKIFSDYKWYYSLFYPEVFKK